MHRARDKEVFALWVVCVDFEPQRLLARRLEIERVRGPVVLGLCPPAYVSIRQHTSAYVSIFCLFCLYPPFVLPRVARRPQHSCALCALAGC